jgi:hypothetical protein
MWQAKTEGDMAPVERALVLAVMAALGCLLVMRTGAGRVVAAPLLYEAVAVVVIAFFSGLISGLPPLMRIATSAVLMLIGTYVYARSIVPEVVTWTVFLLALPMIDPPVWLRRWSRARIWLWPIYYASSALLILALAVAFLLPILAIEKQEAPRALVSAAFAGIAISLVYSGYRLRSSRVRRPAVLLLRSAIGAPPDEVVRQISRALGAKFLLVVLELELANRGLRAAGRLGRFAYLGFEHLLLYVMATACIGLAIFAVIMVLQYGFHTVREARNLIVALVLAVGAVAWVRRSFVMNWRVGRALDRVRIKRVSNAFGQGPKLFKVRVGERAWREAVELLGDECDCLLIDLSTVDRASWEIDHLKAGWNGRAAVLLNEATALPAALKGPGVPVVRYSPGIMAWKDFATQLRKTVAALLSGIGHGSAATA